MIEFKENIKLINKEERKPRIGDRVVIIKSWINSPELHRREGTVIPSDEFSNSSLCVTLDNDTMSCRYFDRTSLRLVEEQAKLDKREKQRKPKRKRSDLIKIRKNTR